jgi:hypothetical protein
MTNIRIGLVAEGPTDFIVLKSLLRSSLSITYPEIKVDFVDLQPSIDRTSGSPEGGWQMVLQWCLNNAPEFRRQQYLGPGLFEGHINPKQCDVLIVQVDSDICADITSRHTHIRPGVLDTPKSRGDFIHAVVNDWLWPVPSVPDDLHVVVPAVEAIETWLVAALGSHDEPEKLPNPGRALVEIDCARRGRPVPAAARGISKKPHRYSPLAEAAGQKVEIIIKRCYWFAQMIRRVRVLAASLS